VELSLDELPELDDDPFDNLTAIYFGDGCPEFNLGDLPFVSDDEFEYGEVGFDEDGVDEEEGFFSAQHFRTDDNNSKNPSGGEASASDGNAVSFLSS